MWTTENRSRYDPSKLRYPSDLTDEEWSLVGPVIPPAKRGGNKRTVDVREIVNGILYILGTGCQWGPCMMSFTGSTRAGIAVAKTAADTVKRVTRELGGKSANVVLPDADFAIAVAKGVEACFGDSGQSCDAPTRTLVPQERHEEALRIAKQATEAQTVGAPNAPGTVLGPVVSQAQFDKIHRLIETGITEGATLATGGDGRPEHLNRGYYVRPTVFGHVKPSMTVVREEIFGPVLAVLPHRDEDAAAAIANDTLYGYDSSVVTSGTDTWATLWDPKYSGKVGMFDDAYATLPFIAKYVGAKDPFNLTDAEFEKVKDALKRLRPQVRTITQSFDEAAALYASGDAVIGICQIVSVVNTLQDKHLPFTTSFPREGTPSWIDNQVVTRKGDRPESYALIDAALDAKWQARFIKASANNGILTAAAMAAGLTRQQLARTDILAQEQPGFWDNLFIFRAPENMDRRLELWNDFKAGTL